MMYRGTSSMFCGHCNKPQFHWCELAWVPTSRVGSNELLND